MATLESPSLNELNERGSVWYENIRPSLEAEHGDEYVAIDVETGEYALGETSAKATRAMYARHPEASFYVRRVIDRPEPELAARLFGVSPAQEPERK